MYKNLQIKIGYKEYIIPCSDEDVGKINNILPKANAIVIDIKRQLASSNYDHEHILVMALLAVLSEQESKLKADSSKANDASLSMELHSRLSNIDSKLVQVINNL